MSPRIDSVNSLKHRADSLQSILQKIKIYDNAIHWNEPAVQAAALLAFSTIITVILGFIFKDFWIPGWIDNRKKDKEGQALFSVYKINIFHAAQSLNHRIYEIYRTRSHYLWDRNLNNHFYDYKYKSSVFRLCVLFGWLRAYKLLLAEVKIDRNDSRYHEINKCILGLEAAFADGQHVEIFVARSILLIIQVDIKTLSSKAVEELSINIDHYVMRYLEYYKTDILLNVPEKGQSDFIKDLQELLLKLNITDKNISSHSESIVKQVSIKLALLYRDWQQAIGDLMLEKDEEAFRTISYRKFEEYWELPMGSTEKKWLVRAESIFGDLDTTVDPQLDSRIKQLKDVYHHVYRLLKALQHTKVGVSPLLDDDFKKIPDKIW